MGAGLFHCRTWRGTIPNILYFSGGWQMSPLSCRPGSAASLSLNSTPPGLLNFNRRARDHSAPSSARRPGGVVAPPGRLIPTVRMLAPGIERLIHLFREFFEGIGELDLMLAVQRLGVPLQSNR
jgi:hypothetical protein